MKLLREYLFIALLSGVLGIAVALPFLPLFDTGAAEYIAKSCLCGAAIGAATKTTFIFFFRNVMKKTALSFLTVIGTISVFTYAASYIMGLRGALPALGMVLLADAAGMTANVLIYRYTRRINRKLREAQKEIREARTPK